MKLRNGAKAIVIQDGRLLVNRNVEAGNVYYVLPGGGQKPGETLVDALKREVLEETGAEVSVGDLRCVREYIGRNHEFAWKHGELHEIEFDFDCRLERGPDPALCTHLDPNQTGVEWLDLARLSDYPLYPRALVPILTGERPDPPVYLGDVN